MSIRGGRSGAENEIKADTSQRVEGQCGGSGADYRWITGRIALSGHSWQ